MRIFSSRLVNKGEITEIPCHFFRVTAINFVNEALEGGPSIPYPFNYFEKYSVSLKNGKYPQNSESIVSPYP